MRGLTYIAMGTVLCFYATPALSRISSERANPLDQTGAPCGRTYPGKTSRTAVIYSLRNRCGRTIYFDGYVGKYPVGRPIGPGETAEATCLLQHRNLCTDGKLRGTFYDLGEQASPRTASTGARASSAASYRQPGSGSATGLRPAGTTGRIIAVAARGNPGSFFSYDDYPIDAIRAGASGRTTVRYIVGEDGRIGDCVVVSSSGNTSLDMQTCRVLMMRGRYAPALDAKGRPVVQSVTSSVVWRLPVDPVPAQSAATSARSYDTYGATAYSAPAPSAPPPRSNWQQFNDNFNRQAADLYRRKQLEKSGSGMRSPPCTLSSAQLAEGYRCSAR